jgi:hypothetical protein
MYESAQLDSGCGSVGKPTKGEWKSQPTFGQRHRPLTSWCGSEGRPCRFAHLECTPHYILKKL